MVSSTPRPYFTPGKDPVPIVQEAGWAPGLVRTGGKSRPTGIRSPDCPARSQSLYRLSYPAHCSVLIHGLFLDFEFVEYSILHFLSLVVVFNFSVALFLFLSVGLISSQAHIFNKLSIYVVPSD